ncbi:Fcf2-domain-containing protein [Neoconidiobolus thromboides FSU 785]|nr:Fcf2-domain-containing protein [Neoconidiobolus thromboides FSU 785]
MNRALPEYRLTHAEAKKEKEANAGKKWFNMEAPEMTEELKKDLQVLKLRKVLDRKRFYKKDNKSLQSKYFQVGTIIEDKSEFYSGRLAKKDRKQTILQEVLHDKQAQTYFKDRFQQHQQSIRANPKKPSVLKKFKYRK